MKKIVTLVSALMLMLVLVACSPVKTSIFGGSFFLSNSSNQGVSDIDETNVYTVSFAQAEGKTTTVITVDSEKSSYTTHLTDTVYGANSTPCYLLETTLNVVGSIDNRGEVVPFNDTISTKCYFLGIGESLKPLYSERTVKSKSIVSNSKTTQTELYVDIADYEYKLITEYDGTTAYATTEVTTKPENDLRFTSFEKKEFINKDDSVSYIDNELLMFAPRTMLLTSSTAKKFNTLDVVSQQIHKMNLTSIANEPTKTFKDFGTKGYFRNGEKVLEVIAYGVEMKIDSDAPGSSIVAYYADTNNKNEHASMISAQSQAPYGLGVYTYTINSAKTNQ